VQLTTHHCRYLSLSVRNIASTPAKTELLLTIPHIGRFNLPNPVKSLFVFKAAVNSETPVLSTLRILEANKPSNILLFNAASTE
jgi:hypothetical protein